MMLNKVNYRIEGKAEDVVEVPLLLRPGDSEFIRLEKLQDDLDASVRIHFRFC